ncbi:MAG: STM4015 family protein [Chloroflexota bacterium]
MQIYQHKSELNGQSIRDWHSEQGGYSPEYSVYRVRVSHEEIATGHRWVDQFVAFLEAAETEKVTGLVVGAWSDVFGDPNEVVPIAQALVDACDRLPNLNAIFFGDIIAEECNMAWIHLSNLVPLLSAYPDLTYFGVRGASGLSLGSLGHEKLQTLVVESGGSDVQVVRAVTSAQLPALEHLELWLGDNSYDATAKVDDLRPLFSGDLFPQLKYLGLRNSYIADEIAVAIASAPIIKQLDVLDLSLGMLSDRGAAALLASPVVAQLQKLDLHHHFCTEEMMERLQALDIKVDLRYPQYDYMSLPNNAHKQDLNGQPIKEWCLEDGGCSPEFSVYRLRLSYEEADVGERWVDRFAAFLEAAETEKVTGLVVGAWSDAFDDTDEVDTIVQALVVARERLPNLEAIFFGDIISVQSEMPWIALTDLSPLLHAYPNLTYFGVRGTNGLSLGSLCHEKLQTLVVESGGLDVQVIREVTSAQLPALEHLELWLGDSEWGASLTINDLIESAGLDAQVVHEGEGAHLSALEDMELWLDDAEWGANFTIDDLKPVFTGEVFPRLKYLGLRNSDITDDIAVAIAQAPIIEQLDVLDLSLGTLGDKGAAALLASPVVAQLQKLDLHHHFCTEEMMERLQMLGIKVDLSNAKGFKDADDRFVAVGE